MRKGAKRKIGSKAGHKVVVAESQNDEVMMAESLEASTQEQEDDKDEKVNEDKEDEAKDASPSEQLQEHNKAKEVNDDKKKPARRGGNRKRTTNKETGKEPAPRAKKARATKPIEEPEYLEEKRNLQDLWKAAFPVGTELEELDAIYEFNWDFKHLEEALEEGGMLYGKKVFVFGFAEPQLVLCEGASKIVHVPTVVVIESPFPPSDKLAVTSIQSAEEKTIPMKQMKMDWAPYIPFEKRDRQVDRMDFQIFTLSCTQRRAALRHMKEERVKKFEYCLPYFYQPFKEDELEQSTEVKIVFPSEPPVLCEYDWEFDALEEFVDKLIEAEALPAEQKDEFKEFVKESVRAAKKANREAKVARRKAIEEMSEDTKQAFQSMKFYKFYPQPSSDVSGVLKSPFINRYYGNAHQVL